MSRVPSSGATGFFQDPPHIPSQLDDDQALIRVIQLFFPADVRLAIGGDLERFAKRVQEQDVLDYVADAERNLPYVKHFDTWGRRIDELVTNNGWKQLQNIGIAEGIVAIPYERRFGECDRLYQFAKYHLWSGCNAIVTCPSAMTDGAARLIWKHLSPAAETPLVNEQVLKKAYSCLTSRDPTKAWTSGQWMTERAGGSDVSGTETIATRSPTPDDDRQVGTDGSPLGPWSISGFKWFSSATDSQMSVLLAQTSNGLSAFYAPLYILDQRSGQKRLNGIVIQRLKNKLGTKPLPTAELELKGMRGYLLGAEGKGVREISTILNITRMHNAVSAMGSWGRGLAISRAFAKVRKADRRLLIDVPAHMRTLADNHLEYRAHMLLTYFVVALLGRSEASEDGVAIDLKEESSSIRPMLLPEGSRDVYLLLRLLTPVVKALTAKAAIAGLAECMESLGGVGYLENEDMRFNVARLYRDVNVLSIWEGTTNIMADDLTRVVKGRDEDEVLAVLERWSENASRRAGSPASVRNHYVLLDWIKEVRSTHVDSLRAEGRKYMRHLGAIVSALLLHADASLGHDSVAAEIAQRWTATRLGGVDTPTAYSPDVANMDRAICFGASQRAKL